MKAVVLVGGEGTRLRPLTYSVPKPLLPIANVPFLERQLTWLARHGVDEVVLSLGYLPDAFVAHFPEGRFSPPGAPSARGDLRLSYAVEEEPLGTAGGIRYAADQAGIDERFVVCNGDVLTSMDLSALVRFHDERGAEATIHLARVDDPSAFGVVPTYPDGEVKAFVEKPPRDAAPTNWINAGTYVLEPSVLDRIPSDFTVSIERETFPAMLDARGRLYAQPSDAYWIDIGTPEKYLEAHADVLAGRMGSPPAPGAVEHRPGVWVEGAALIDDDAEIEAPILVGAGTTIDAGARVARSVLGARCRVGQDADVDGSVLLSGVRLAAGAQVQSSVVGRDAVVESGAIADGQTVIGFGAVVSGGTRLTGARVAS